MAEYLKYFLSNVATVLLFIGIISIIIALGFLINKKRTRRKKFVIDQIMYGIGGNSITLIPNRTDRQLAHKMWVELNTRKTGLEIDFQIGSKNGDTEFIDLAIDVLNVGLRPHPTLLQARLRHW